MLSEAAKQELKALAKSNQLRRDCEQLRAAWRNHPLSLDQFVQFLTDVSHLFPPSKPSPSIPYTIVRI